MKRKVNRVSEMFPLADQIWPMLQAVRDRGYMPYLLLVPDPTGPLADRPHYLPIHTEVQVQHMDVFKDIVHRWELQMETRKLHCFSITGNNGGATSWRGWRFGEERIGVPSKLWGRMKIECKFASYIIIINVIFFIVNVSIFIISLAGGTCWRPHLTWIGRRGI